MGWGKPHPTTPYSKGKPTIMNEATQKLLSTWKYGTHEMKDETVYIYIEAIFDHDYETHLLVRQYPTNHEVRAGEGSYFSLWFIGHGDVHVSFIASWQRTIPPYIEAATIAEEWYALCSNLSTITDD